MLDETVETRRPWRGFSLPRCPCRGISAFHGHNSTVSKPLRQSLFREHLCRAGQSPCAGHLPLHFRYIHAVFPSESVLKSAYIEVFSTTPVTKCQQFFNHFFQKGKKIERIDYFHTLYLTFHIKFFEFYKLEVFALYNNIILSSICLITSLKTSSPCPVGSGKLQLSSNALPIYGHPTSHPIEIAISGVGILS